MAVFQSEFEERQLLIHFNLREAMVVIREVEFDLRLQTEVRRVEDFHVKPFGRAHLHVAVVNCLGVYFECTLPCHALALDHGCLLVNHDLIALVRLVQFHHFIQTPSYIVIQYLVVACAQALLAQIDCELVLPLVLRIKLGIYIDQVIAQDSPADIVFDCQVVD